jgi:hypothetical protein
MSVVKARSCQVVRSVRLVSRLLYSRLIMNQSALRSHGLSSATRRFSCLMRSILVTWDPLLLLTVQSFSGNLRSRFEFRESRTGCTRQSSYRPDYDRNCASPVNDSECGSDVSVSYIFHTLSKLDPTLHSYFIKDGTVCESGTHDELIARRGDYYEYVQLQALSRK